MKIRSGSNVEAVSLIRLISEPSTPIRSMDELLAVAMAMEKESVDRYADLAARMRAAGRDDLAAVFDRLVEDENNHIDMVIAWSQQALHHAPAAVERGPADVFDDEGAALISPELLDAYRSFAIAVRNEERAFAFWAYVSANAPTDEIRGAAERMAREELEHAKTLRRERRKAFVRHRHEMATGQGPYDLPLLELEVSKALEERYRMNGKQGEYLDLAEEARILSSDLAADPLQDPAPAGPPPPRTLDALCEWLADYYIEAGEHLLSQAARDRAQKLATAAVRRLALVRHLETI
jgi:rubrerythrin